VRPFIPHQTGFTFNGFHFLTSDKKVPLRSISRLKQNDALTALCSGLIHHRISLSSSTDCEMTSVGASTHSHIHDGIVPGPVSNGDDGMSVPDRWNADFRFQQMDAYSCKLAADQGDARGQCNYGLYLEKGLGVEQNFEMAAHYFKLSADQGDAFGQCNYGLCLDKGEGVEQDFRMAAYYLKLSADQFRHSHSNDVDRPEMLHSLILKGNHSVRDDATAAGKVSPSEHISAAPRHTRELLPADSTSSCH
jgi:hypothetical protein